jgi:hypothetical protein
LNEVKRTQSAGKKPLIATIAAASHTMFFGFGSFHMED